MGRRVPYAVSDIHPLLLASVDDSVAQGDYYCALCLHNGDFSDAIPSPFLTQRSVGRALLPHVFFSFTSLFIQGRVSRCFLYAIGYNPLLTLTQIQSVGAPSAWPLHPVVL